MQPLAGPGTQGSWPCFDDGGGAGSCGVE